MADSRHKTISVTGSRSGDREDNTLPRCDDGQFGTNIPMFESSIYSVNQQIQTSIIRFGAWGSIVVKALRYKSGGPGIDSKR